MRNQQLSYYSLPLRFLAISAKSAVTACLLIVSTASASPVSCADAFPTSNLKAVSFVERISQNLHQIFSTTGFPNKKSLEQAIEMQGEDARSILRMVQNGGIEAALVAPEAVRLPIAINGFQTQRTTHTTRGIDTFAGLDDNDRPIYRRDNTEAFMSFSNLSTYQNMNDKLKPKYGYLRPKAGQPLVEEPDRVTQYGSDTYVFKTKEIAPTTTLFVGDSLGKESFGEQNPKTWSKAFIPWADRTLIVPALLRPIDASNRFLNAYGLMENESTELQKKFKHGTYGPEYIELQFWGALTLDQVESFEFRGTPPAGDFLKELNDRNIKIIDARKSTKVSWSSNAH